jgi:hypothetical protein
MLLTKQKNRKQIDNLKMDLEIINPIESKKVLGGDWYNDPDPKGYDWMEPVNVYYDYGGWWDNNLPDNYNDPGSWGGGDYTGGGGQGSSAEDYPGNLTYAELSWLAQHPTHIADMINNKNLALQQGQTLPGTTNGLGDALRHTLWSALDAADIGLALAKEFHTLHESEHPDFSNAMDLFNNNWGFNWYSQHGDPENNMQQFRNDFDNAVATGQIQTRP